MQEFEEDFYAILGVEDSATPEEIRKAYLTLARKLHPDRHPNDAEQRAIAQSQFAKVSRAHDVVGDSDRRTEYDALRELSRKRGGGGAMSPAEPIAARASSDAAKISEPGDRPMTREEQQTTTSDEENINVKWANKHLARADDLYKNKRYQEAETAMKEAIRLVPGDPKYRNKLAEIYLARGWKTLAMTEVQASMRIDPKDVEAKMLDVKIKQAMKSQAQTQPSKTKAKFMDQIKNLFSKKR